VGGCIIIIIIIIIIQKKEKQKKKILKYGLLGLYIFIVTKEKNYFFYSMYELSLPSSYPKTKYEKIETLRANMFVIISVNYIYSS